MSLGRGKLVKYKLLAKSRSLRGALPETKSMCKKHFCALLRRYGNVIVKPSGGSGGAGVIRVRRTAGSVYEVHYGKTVKTCGDLQQAYRLVRGKTSGRSHIVQRTVALAKAAGRPFDIRVMVQRKAGRDWTVTGKLAKIAGPGYIITNVERSKGRVAPLPETIRRSNVRCDSTDAVLARIDRIGLRSARQLCKQYRMRTLGLDVAVTPSGKVWIIEANLSPAKSLFRKLADKSMYRRIMAWHKG